MTEIQGKLYYNKGVHSVELLFFMSDSVSNGSRDFNNVGNHWKKRGKDWRNPK
jgi:hypothetical protein